MKVFVSWSGDTSKAVATALRNWLRYVFPKLDPWMSEQDIQAGAKWGFELGKALGECKLGIICVTPESLRSSWLAFEAGALSVALDSPRVIPYRFHVRTADIIPPFSQFQDVGADEEGTYRLVRSINDGFEREWYPEEEDARIAFQQWWPKLRDELAKLEGIGPSQIRSDRELLEEILDLARKESIRGLDAILTQLFTIPNVRRVEVAQKEIGGKKTRRVALRITVAKKLAMTEIPTEQLIPTTIFGMPTDVVEGA